MSKQYFLVYNIDLIKTVLAFSSFHHRRRNHDKFARLDEKRRLEPPTQPKTFFRLKTMPLITEFLHASLIVSDTPRSLKFYIQCLGFSLDNQRPDLGFPGAWLKHGHFSLHLLEVENPDPVDHRPAHGGRDRHLAFGTPKLEELIEHLDRAQIHYTLSQSGRHALFCRDPDGNTLEFIENRSFPL